MRSPRPGPFRIGVRDIVRRPGEMREVAVDTLAPGTWGEGLVAIREGSPIRMELRLESVHEGILVSARASADYDGVCGRCLTDVHAPVEVEFQELFAYSGTEDNDLEVQDDHVDLETEVRDAFVLSLPFQPICRSDCPGLDPETGDLLAEGAAPASRDVPDPRWERLAELRSNADDPTT